MDFDLSDEQSLLKDSVTRWSSDTYGTLEQLAAARAAPLGFPEAGWAELAELGLLGLPFSEEDGGVGGGSVETLVVMEALGRAMAPEPYLASIVLGGGALRLSGTAKQKAALLPALMDGSARLAFAHAEAQARYDLNDVATTARAVEGGFRLDGRKSVVLNADAAMELHGGLAHEARGLVDLDLRGGERGAPLALVGRVQHHARIERHGPRLFQRHEHIHGLMLQRLEGADGDAELLAGLQIVHGQAVKRLHQAHRLGTDRRDGAFGDALDHAQPLSHGAEHRL